MRRVFFSLEAMVMSLATSYLESEDIDLVSRDQQSDVERMHDVLLLIEDLFKREAATEKLILERLYDIGSQTLINQKIPYRPANRVMHWVVKNAKPVALMVGLRWFRQRAPKLISDWLYSQVSFGESYPGDSAGVAIQSTDSFIEIQRLRAQVRWLSGLTIGAIAMLIGVLLN